MLKKLIPTLLLFTSTLFGSGWTLDTMFKVKQLGQTAPSPDGKAVVYKVNKKSSSALILKNLGDEAEIEIAKNAALPKWSPDGKTVAFLNMKSRQIMLYDVHNDKIDALTNFTQNILNFQWSPNGKVLAFLMQKPLDKNAISTAEEEQKSNQILCLISKNGKHFRKITDGSFNIGAGFFSNAFAFSPDGKEIVCPKTPHAAVGRWAEAELIKIDLNSGETTSFVPPASAEPIYSPDGKWVAYLKLDPEWTSTQDVWVVPASGGIAKALAQTPNRDVLKVGALLGWSEDSQSVYVLDYNRTKAEILALPLSGEKIKKFETGVPTITGACLSEDHQSITFVGQSAAEPPEVYKYDLHKQKSEPITQLNASLPLTRIARTELITYTAQDGLEIEGLLTYPLGYNTSKRFPLLLIVHGGPCYFSHEEFIGSPSIYPIATFASQGYGILQCNIRGSTGYGWDFRRKNLADFGGKDYQDLMSGIETLESRGLIDPDRLGVMGWSYGGYMSAWIITQTDRFKAASVGAGVINLVSMYGTSDIPNFLPNYFGGELWEKFDLFLERSAIFHVKNVSTPTLIQHGKEDRRVPVTQSMEFYNALKRNGVETKLMLFPRSQHSIKEFELLYKGAQANVDWFNKFIQNVNQP